MRKLHLKKRGKFLKINLKKKKTIKEKIIIIAIFLIITISLTFTFINKKITPILMIYAENKSRTIANAIITSAVDNKYLNQLNKKNIFIEKKDINGNIISTDFDSVEINKLLNDISNQIELYIDKLEAGKVPKKIKRKFGIKNTKKGIAYEIPSGIITNNALLSNLGPKVPVRLNLNSDALTNIKTEVTNYGINNALIKVSISIKIYMQVIIPFKTKEIVVKNDIPIVMKLAKGEVPNYYPYSTK